MSNPAVIILDSLNSEEGRFKRFQIEDNIGEAIHLHMDDTRIDFTINDFLDFSRMIKESLNELGFLGKYHVDQFDKQFLRECGGMLSDLVKIEIEEIKLSDLKCITYSDYRGDLNLIKILPIEKTAAFQYLQGNKQDFLDYEQYNYFNVDNETRLLNILESIKINNYPYNDEFIILFEGQNYIRDGQHRAAILAHLQGLGSVVKVMRFYFCGRKYLIYARGYNLRMSLRWFAWKVYRKLKRLL